MPARSRAGSGAPPRGDGRAGYALIEVTAALALTGLLIAFAYPMITARTSSTGFSALVTSTVALLRDARTAAQSGGAPVSATFLPARRLLQAGRTSVQLPADVELVLTAGGNCPADLGVVRILFRPDGTNCGGTLRFSQDARIARVRVDWVTGRIDVLHGE